MKWNLCNGIPFFWKARPDYHGQGDDKIVSGSSYSHVFGSTRGCLPGVRLPGVIGWLREPHHVLEVLLSRLVIYTSSRIVFIS